MNIYDNNIGPAIVTSIIANSATGRKMVLTECGGKCRKWDYDPKKNDFVNQAEAAGAVAQHNSWWGHWVAATRPDGLVFVRLHHPSIVLAAGFKV